MIDGLFDEKVLPQQDFLLEVHVNAIGSQLVHATVSSQPVQDRLEKEPLQELQVRISYLEIYKEFSQELRKKPLMAKTVWNRWLFAGSKARNK